MRCEGYRGRLYRYLLYICANKIYLVALKLLLGPPQWPKLPALKHPDLIVSKPVEESDDEDMVVPTTPPRTAPIAEES